MMPRTLTRLPATPQLAAMGALLRPQTDGDLPFVCHLYASTRWEELAATAWPDDMKSAFLKQQFRLQYAHYTRYYEGAAFGIVEFAGNSAGRMYLLQTQSDLRIIDVSLLPEYRNRGLGSALLHAVFDQARETGSKVSIHVEANNPARRLYLRSGFQVTGDPDPRNIYQLMEWSPTAERVS